MYSLGLVMGRTFSSSEKTVSAEVPDDINGVDEDIVEIVEEENLRAEDYPWDLAFEVKLRRLGMVKDDAISIRYETCLACLFCVPSFPLTLT